MNLEIVHESWETTQVSYVHLNFQEYGNLREFSTRTLEEIHRPQVSEGTELWTKLIHCRAT